MPPIAAPTGPPAKNPAPAPVNVDNAIGITDIAPCPIVEPKYLEKAVNCFSSFKTSSILLGLGIIEPSSCCLKMYAD